MISNFGKSNKKKGKKTIVIMSIPGVVEFPWSNDVDAIIADFYGGEQMAPALLNILYGHVTPSGKLPVTLQKTENDEKITPEQYPGVDWTSTYTEKLNMGYRWFDANKVEPLFPFGHGLSYTSFNYKEAKVEGRKVSVEVTNSGEFHGKEVVQLYVGFPEEAEEPPKLLKGFSKISLEVGETGTAEFELRDRDLSIWDVEVHAWKLIEGEFNIFVGSSSRDIRTQVTMNVTK
jgi:beta-glucosidase